MSASKHLLVADLSGTEQSRSFVRVAGKLNVMLQALRFGSEPVHVLSLAPWGDALTLEIPGRSVVLQISDTLTAQEIEAIDQWTFSATRRFAREEGRHLFPETLGVSHSQLNLLPLQTDVRQFLLLSEAAKALLRKEEYASCIICARHAEFARSLNANLKPFVRRTKTVYLSESLGSILKPLQRNPAIAKLPASTGRPAAEDIARIAGTSPILLFADSTPQLRMFESIAPVLHARGIGPLVVMQLAQDPSEPLPRSFGASVPFRYPEPATAEGAAHALSTISAVERLTGLTDDSGTERTVPLSLGIKALQRNTNALQISAVRYVASVLDTVRPRLVVVANDRWWAGQMFSRLAHLRGIPSLAVQDGTEGDVPGWGWFVADYFATSGQNLITLLQRYGTDVSHCRATGQPRYDQLVAQDRSRSERARARESLKISPSDFIVLFAAQTGQDDNYTRAVIRGVLAVDGTKLVLRPHPSSPAARYKRIASEYSADRVVMQSSSDPYEALRAADILVTQHSTVAMEAIAVGTPAITANFGGLPDPVPYVELGIATGARDTATLSQAVMRIQLQSHEEREASLDRARRGIEKLIGVSDGRAAERLAAYITEILAQPSPA